MSDYDPALVEKAAEALVPQTLPHYSTLDESGKETWRRMARAVLDAVAPALRADAWDEGKKAGRSDQSAQQIWAVTGGTRPTDTPNPYREVAQ